LPPDVNSSGLDFTVEGDKIRFGLSAIKNVGESAIRSILQARERKGRFSTLHALSAETDSRLVNRRALEALVQSGALDTEGVHRSQLAAVIDAALEYGQKCRADREAGQASLFSPGAGQEDVGEIQERYPELPEWDEKTRLAHEKATLGFYVTGHPLESFRELLAEFATHSTAQLREGSVEGEVAVGGIITDLRKRKSRKTGSWWASTRLEDLEGLVEVLIFPKTFEGCQKYLENDRPVLVAGKLETDEDRIRIIASSVTPLEALRETRADAVQVRLEASDLDEDLVSRLRTAVAAHHGDTQLFLEVDRLGSYRLVVKAEPALRVTPSPALTRDIEAVVGSGRVRYRSRQVR